jgi:D-tyrosyl-tRNA(Tyr) deacylase
MRAVVQLVSRAAVTVDKRRVGEISAGLLVFLGVGKEDSAQDASFLAEKICNLRIFQDDGGLMNRSLLETSGEMLVVSQFTLFGDCRKGRRPSFSQAAPPDQAKRLYEMFMAEVEKMGITTASGEFQAMMEVSLVNDGPVTLLVDSQKKF